MENITMKRNEKSPQKIETITGQELLNRIYKGESFPQDTRFLPTEKGGVFKYLDINEIPENSFYPIIEFDNKIVGLAELEQDPSESRNLWIKFVSVDPEYQGNKFATALIEEIVAFAKHNGYSLEISRYSDEGEKKIKHLFQEFAEKSSVKIIDSSIK